jgi:hypothetical protein
MYKHIVDEYLKDTDEIRNKIIRAINEGKQPASIMLICLLEDHIPYLLGAHNDALAENKSLQCRLQDYHIQLQEVRTENKKLKEEKASDRMMTMEDVRKKYFPNTPRDEFRKCPKCERTWFPKET